MFATSFFIVALSYSMAKLFSVTRLNRMLGLRSWAYAGYAMLFILYIGILVSGFISIIILKTLLVILAVYVLAKLRHIREQADQLYIVGIKNGAAHSSITLDHSVFIITMAAGVRARSRPKGGAASLRATPRWDKAHGRPAGAAANSGAAVRSLLCGLFIFR